MTWKYKKSAVEGKPIWTTYLQEEELHFGKFSSPPPYWTILHPSTLTRQLLKFLFMLWLPQELIFIILFYDLPLPGYFEVATYSAFSRCFKPGSILLPLFRLPLVTPSIKRDCSFAFNFSLLCRRTTLLVLSLSPVGSVRRSEWFHTLNCSGISKYNCTFRTTQTVLYRKSPCLFCGRKCFREKREKKKSN